jgi:predicted DNA-binding antitoxin AbrB/MazE fold protein
MVADGSLIMRVVHAIFESGVFRPTGPVDLPDPCEVEFEPRPVNGTVSPAALDEVYAVLGERFASGHTDTAARHDEHQP